MTAPMEPSSDRTGPRPALLAAVPNLLSGCRLLLGLAFPALPASWRFAAVIAALATEFLDGALSRWWHVASNTGRVLDPVADKVFVLSVLGTLVFEGRIALGALALIGARDLMVVAGCVYLAARRGPAALARVPPRLLGKLATACQFGYMVLALLIPRSLSPALVVTAAVSVAAGLDYWIRGQALLTRGPNGPDRPR